MGLDRLAYRAGIDVVGEGRAASAVAVDVDEPRRDEGPRDVGLAGIAARQHAGEDSALEHEPAAGLPSIAVVNRA